MRVFVQQHDMVGCILILYPLSRWLRHRSFPEGWWLMLYRRRASIILNLNCWRIDILHGRWKQSYRITCMVTMMMLMRCDWVITSEFCRVKKKLTLYHDSNVDKKLVRSEVTSQWNLLQTYWKLRQKWCRSNGLAGVRHFWTMRSGRQTIPV